MPRAIQIPLIDPDDLAQLPATADPGTVLLYVRDTDSMAFLRDDAGLDVPIGGDSVVYIHNPVVTSAASPYAAVVNETVEVNPTGGVTVQLPDPTSVAGRVIRVVNVTNVVNPLADPFDTDAITVEALIGGLSGQDPAFPQDVLRTAGESREYESNGTAWVII